jgi:hypothetical protein
MVRERGRVSDAVVSVRGPGWILRQDAGRAPALRPANARSLDGRIT